MTYLFTSESVCAGHADKICDQISDAILDACFADDVRSRVAVEALAKGDTVVLAGEITSRASPDFERIVREVVRDVGYVNPEEPFNADGIRILQMLTAQAAEIATAVDRGPANADGDSGESGSSDAADEDEAASTGAGDQGLMFGYATTETPELMPLPILLAHRLAEGLGRDRREGLDWIGPDGKTQVTVAYEDEAPVRVEKVLVSTQHAAGVRQSDVHAYVRERLVPRVLGDWFRDDLTMVVNPSGSFVEGGPSIDAGLTGRKIIVDTYGGFARHGGGAFSGKDPSKVDRSGAYFARYVARRIVEEGLARRAEVQVAYGIGLEDPFSLYVETFGTGDGREAAEFARRFDFRPARMIEQLDLLRPIYRQTATFGHFGKAGMPWEEPGRASSAAQSAA